MADEFGGTVMISRSLVFTSALIAGLGLLVDTISAQQNDNLAGRLVENAQELRDYSWTKRTATRIEGGEIVRLDKMRYDIDGRLQRTSIGGSGEIAPELVTVVRDLTDHGIAYSQPNPDEYQAFIQSKAEVWAGQGSGAGVVRIEGRGFLQTADRIDLRGRNGKPEKLTVESTYKGSPIRIQSEYRSLPNDGPTYVARMIVSYPAESMEVTVENFDYQYNAPVAAGDMASIAAGTDLFVRISQPLSSAKNQGGETFEAILDRDVVVNGRTVLPQGTGVIGEIVDAKASGRVKGRAVMALRLKALVPQTGEVTVTTNVLSFEAEGTGRRDAARIGGAAGIGAVIGAIAGGGSGAAKGAAIGAGAGTGVTLATKGDEVVFDVEQLFSFTLQEPLKILPR
jgi:hypothetical protein